MARVVHFEIHAQDVERARRFYEHAFGWTFQQWGNADYWLINTGPDEQPGINGGLLPRRGDAPAEGQAMNGYVCTLEVADLATALRAVEFAGGSEAVARVPIAGVGWLAYAKDTEGNLFGLMQSDETAA